jgi:glycosyltransferase involved in cell wall biosynthesis
VRILIAHNRYQIAGGEDSAVDQDVAMLRQAGHDVTVLMVDNHAIRTGADKLRAAVRVARNPEGVGLVAEALHRSGAELLHVHNFFPLLSPAVYAAARHAGAAVVQTLHNYRTVCANGLLLRSGRSCEKCLTGSPLWGVVHRCYRGSAAGSAAVAHMIAHHRRKETWSREVDRFVVLSEFARRKFADAGFPEDRMVVRPNAVDDPGPPVERRRRGVLYVGRLSEEKGVAVLLEAAKAVAGEVLIVGEGDLEGTFRAAAPDNVRFLGLRPRAEVRAMMADAKALVLPSICYEGSPMTLSEAYAAGTPVVGSRLGSFVGLIVHGRTGLHAAPGDVGDLAAQINTIMEDGVAEGMGREARIYYESHLTPQRALATLETVYERALGSAGAARPRARPLVAEPLGRL